MKHSLFRNKQRSGASSPQTQLDVLIGGIQNKLNSNGSSFATKSVAGYAMSMESISETSHIEIDNSVDALQVALEQVALTHTPNVKFSQAQMTAGIAAGIIAGDVQSFLRQPISRSIETNANLGFVGTQGLSEALEERMRPALEAYDEKENKNAVTYSVAYNMSAARQDEFAETFFPTVVVTPDQVGFTISIRLITVYDEVRRQISGQLDSFNKRNIVQAVIDPTILKNDQTKIYPIYRTESAAKFVDPALIAPQTIVFEGESITTSALAMGVKFSLLGISQTEALLETGLQDTTDSIDTALKLEALYLKIVDGAGFDVVKFKTGSLPLATFTYSVQNLVRTMNLAFDTSSLQINKNTLNVAGGAAAALAPIVTGQYSVRLAVSVSGSVNLELADTNLFSSQVSVATVTDQDGNQLDLTSGTGLAIANIFAGASMIGYDLDARRTNLNRRMRGQLLDTAYYNQVYAVPLLAPITVPRPLTVSDANDSSDLAALITATHIRTTNAAIAEILRVAGILQEYVNNKDSLSATPAILGVARFILQPFFEYRLINVATEVDSLTSTQRKQDIQELLVNQLRDTAYRMYRDSGYKAAADALAGGLSQVPTVIIGTDPVISRYLTVTGDFRTLGNDFNVRVVSTLNNTMAGKIVMSFGQFGEGLEGVPNPMHFGNMAWKPELTLVLPLHRNGANSKELTVQPSFLHVTNLPILAVFDVVGISDVIASKVPLNFHTV